MMRKNPELEGWEDCFRHREQKIKGPGMDWAP